MKSFVRSIEPVETYPVGRRYFSVEEANRALVLVRRIVSDVIVEYARLVDLQEMIEEAEESEMPQEAADSHDLLVDTVDRLQRCLEELDQVGVELKDWSQGLVDFPCFVGDREVCLCWRYGEKQVGHWHETHGGFAGRKSIDTLPAARLAEAAG